MKRNHVCKHKKNTLLIVREDILHIVEKILFQNFTLLLHEKLPPDFSLVTRILLYFTLWT